MERFRTTIPIQRAPFSIGHADGLLLVGSCFTEHIGARLAACKFRVLTNPRGIVYNPASIASWGAFAWRAFATRDSGRRVVNSPHDGLWHSWDHHSDFSRPDRESLLAAIDAAEEKTAIFLKNTTRLLLTFGTADVFALRENGHIVANNHKMPAALFEQRRLSVAEIVDGIGDMLQQLKSQLPELQVILTVSPVRHLRAGAVENQRSKATLVLACAELTAALPYTWYFPAYELVLDDLRDYRFYAADMLHPSEVAVAYIWQHFADAFFTSETKALLTDLEKIQTAVRHRPFNPDTEQHKNFARGQLQAIGRLQAMHPDLDFSAEQTHFQTFL